MARLDIEAEFVGTFWLAAIEPGGVAAWTALQAVKSEMIEDSTLRKLFLSISQRFAAGTALETSEIASDAGLSRAAAEEVWEEGTLPDALPALSDEIVAAFRRLQFQGLIEKAGNYLASNKPKDHGKAAAEKLALRLMELYGEEAAGGVYTKEEVVRLGIERTTTDEKGLAFPWRELEREAGPLIEGEVCGIVGYSGNGKTQLIANLFRHWGRWGVPMIVYPTEMRMQWFDRIVAAEANVEQWRAEKRQWKGAEEQRQHYVETYQKLKQWEWIMPRASNFSPAEIAIGARVLRRKYGNRLVVVIVDHMHRLRYEEDANKEAGKATALFKEVAMNEGLVFVLNYQPRKPPETGTIYGPPDGHMIRGDSTAWTELDVLLAPFRQWVKTSEMGLTPWGSPQCIFNEHGSPKIAKPNAEKSKLDDEHVYVKVGKRRVGGEGPVVAMDYWKPSGRIYDESDEILWTGGDGAPLPGASEAASRELLGLLEEGGWGPPDSFQQLEP